MMISARTKTAAGSFLHTAAECKSTQHSTGIGLQVLVSRICAIHGLHIRNQKALCTRTRNVRARIGFTPSRRYSSKNTRYSSTREMISSF